MGLTHQQACVHSNFLQFFCSIRTSLLVDIMKILLVALFCFSAALATPELTPDNDFGKECIDIQRNCMASASSALERGQCWVQFGLCIATHGMKCYKTCIPPMQECIAAAGHDFMKTLACGADYIKCVTHCE